MPQAQTTPPSDEANPALKALANSGTVDEQPDEKDDADRAYAVKQGWKPREQYKGPAEDFIDYKVYAQRAREINPIINERNRSLTSENDRLRAQIEELRKDTKEALQFQREFDKRAHESEITALKKQRADAIKDGDGEKVNEIDDKIDKAKEKATKKDAETKKEIADTPTAREITAAAKRFAEENPWINDDKDRRTRVAFVVSQDLLRSRPDIAGTAKFYDELIPALEKEYPELFPTKTARTITDGDGAADRSSGAHSGSHTYADLPKAAKETCDRYIQNGWIKHKDGEKAARNEYASVYFENLAKENRRG